ncbi:glycosyltransferase family 1 protein [Asaia sp. As-1742]|uniref:glycosyltransferase family 4 protein n=1 Tax=Asaia sp. As-1742 TaxID=2608325 RepID=UPI0014226EA8|nr:glycosyltransferase family 1 protein [Asaia sp. As-1742]NIE80775.1 glycosyltransferase family 4 protein [Asaia sp. As-1742]
MSKLQYKPIVRSKRTRIFVDGFNLSLPKGTGVATYARALTCLLRDMGHDIGVLYGMNISKRTSLALREVIFFDSLDGRAPRRKILPLSSRWWKLRVGELIGEKAVQIPVTGRVEARSLSARMPEYDQLWNVPDLYERASRYFRRTGRMMEVSVPGGIDIMHWTYPMPIRVKGAKNIYTIHDIVPLKLPYTTLDDKGYYFRLIRKLSREADAICTVSEASKREILDFFPQLQGKIYNTYQSFEPKAVATPEAREMHAKVVRTLCGRGLDQFYLFFGSLEPKKNIGRLIEGFLSAQTDRVLVIVGAMAWKAEAELRYLDKGIEQGRIIQLEYLPSSSLQSLIVGAKAVLFPSLSEGFGLPVLEALAAGTPVLTSREGALPEVAGDAAIFVDAYDVGSIARGIETIDCDDDLRMKIADEACSQVKKFDMASYAERVALLYGDILKN